MKKITLRTKIYLTLVGLLALTGVLYASTPSVFVSPGNGVYRPISLAADPDSSFVSQYIDNQIKMVDCFGIGTLFGTLPAPIPPFDGEIHGYRSSGVRGGRVHPGRPFRHTKPSGL